MTPFDLQARCATMVIDVGPARKLPPNVMK
jgi:hypothetical protein